MAALGCRPKDQPAILVTRAVPTRPLNSFVEVITIDRFARMRLAPSEKFYQ
jgi:hypothetical protein